MANRKIIVVVFFFLTSTLVYGQQDSLFLSDEFNGIIEKMKLIVIDYISESDNDDYKIIINIRKDTIDLYLDTYTSQAAVGYLEPFILYRLKGKKVYLFMTDGLKWGKDPIFNVSKSEVTIDDNPTWLIKVSNNSLILKKGVRGYFAPPLPPKGKDGKFIRPKVVYP